HDRVGVAAAGRGVGAPGGRVGREHGVVGVVAAVQEQADEGLVAGGARRVRGRERGQVHQPGSGGAGGADGAEATEEGAAGEVRGRHSGHFWAMNSGLARVSSTAVLTRFLVAASIAPWLEAALL